VEIVAADAEEVRLGLSVIAYNLGKQLVKRGDGGNDRRLAGAGEAREVGGW
jgi:hypothetical protein